MLKPIQIYSSGPSMVVPKIGFNLGKCPLILVGSITLALSIILSSNNEVKTNEHCPLTAPIDAVKYDAQTYSTNKWKYFYNYTLYDRLPNSLDKGGVSSPLKTYFQGINSETYDNYLANDLSNNLCKLLHTNEWNKIEAYFPN